MRLLLISLIACCAATPVSGQGFTVFFSMDGTETSASGAGGSATSPGNWTAVFRDEAIIVKTTGAVAHSCAPKWAWATWFGDDDGDDNFTEGVLGNLDALHPVSGGANPPSLFDFWVSFSNNAGPGGILGTSSIEDGDVVRLNPAGGFVPYITEVQIRLAMNTTADLDVNGFTVDTATGDLYWTLTTTQTVNGVMVQDGGVLRLPASAYVANGDGTVASVTAGGAQIALFELHLDLFYSNAGLGGVVDDLDGIAIDPAGGSFTGPGGYTLPHFWFAADNAAGPAIVSSSGLGSVATQSGTSFSDAASLGLSSTDFQGGANSSVTALAWTSAAMATTTRILNAGTVDLTTPGSLTVDGGGFTPGANCWFVARYATVTPSGAFSLRSDVTGGPLDAPGAHPELYIINLMDPIVQLTINAPPATVDAQGHTSRTWSLPGIPAGFGFIVQAYDLAAGALSTPVTVVTQ